MKTFKRYLLLLVAGFITFFATAQEKGVKSEEKSEGYIIKDVKVLPATPVKDQARSGTCWAFSSLSFLESEMLRQGYPVVDLSEMYIVHKCYLDKAVKYVRLHGELGFSSGGVFNNATHVLRDYGLVPEAAYSGLNIGEKRHIHGEMDQVLEGLVESIIKNKNKKITPVWQDVVKATLNAYLGEIPGTFNYEGKEYSPRSFADEYCGIDPDDYIEITSYMHHPYYSKFAIEIPDNWMWKEVYNVPLNELIEIIDHSIENGYTVAWGGDTSGKEFNTRKTGVAVVPDIDFTEMSGAEIEKWEALTEKEREKKSEELLYRFDKPGKEKKITPEMRQKAFDNYQTTDDHSVHIIGTAKDQNGTVYYKVKNSWGVYNKYKGYFYMSKPYASYRVTDIMVHKDAVPAPIRKKLGL